jgi:hypothetical protein
LKPARAGEPRARRRRRLSRGAGSRARLCYSSRRIRAHESGIVQLIRRRDMTFFRHNFAENGLQDLKMV